MLVGFLVGRARRRRVQFGDLRPAVAVTSVKHRRAAVKLSSTGTFTIFNYGGTGICSGMLGAGSLTTDTINAVPW